MERRIYIETYWCIILILRGGNSGELGGEQPACGAPDYGADLVRSATDVLVSSNPETSPLTDE